MGEEKRGPLADTPVPTEPPSVPEDVVDAVLAALSGHVEAVFRPWIADRFSVEWLDVNDDRLGMTRFEEGSNELARRRRLRLDPGDVTIGLHPACSRTRRSTATHLRTNSSMLPASCFTPNCTTD